jgi:hypothetical protein
MRVEFMISGPPPQVFGICLAVFAYSMRISIWAYFAFNICAISCLGVGIAIGSFVIPEVLEIFIQVFSS